MSHRIERRMLVRPRRLVVNCSCGDMWLGDPDSVDASVAEHLTGQDGPVVLAREGGADWAVVGTVTEPVRFRFMDPATPEAVREREQPVRIRRHEHHAPGTLHAYGPQDELLAYRVAVPGGYQVHDARGLLPSVRARYGPRSLFLLRRMALDILAQERGPR